MIISRKYIVMITIIILMIVFLSSTPLLKESRSEKYEHDLTIGGYLISPQYEEIDSEQPVFNNRRDEQEVEGFRRPSKEASLPLKYTYEGVEGDHPPYSLKGYPTRYESSVDVIHGYYSLLKEAANMEDYVGGCGSIGWGKIPYSHAHQLLSQNQRNKVSLKMFEASFEGIGHITLLKLLPAYRPEKTPYNIDYHFVEVEVITGLHREEGELQSSYFAYYYGIVETKFSEAEGWKINTVYYTPQDFLCAPYHHWYWHSEAFVEIIYGGWYSIVEEINNIEREGSEISIYARGRGKKYKFDFIRLTNGEDMLLQEYVEVDGRWKEINILKEEHQIYKISPLIFKGN